MNFYRTLYIGIWALILASLFGALIASPVSAAVTQAAFNGPHTLPGLVQAEDFDNGGSGSPTTIRRLETTVVPIGRPRAWTYRR